MTFIMLLTLKLSLLSSSLPGTGLIQAHHPASRHQRLVSCVPANPGYVNQRRGNVPPPLITLPRIT